MKRIILSRHSDLWRCCDLGMGHREPPGRPGTGWRGLSGSEPIANDSGRCAGGRLSQGLQPEVALAELGEHVQLLQPRQLPQTAAFRVLGLDDLLHGVAHGCEETILELRPSFNSGMPKVETADETPGRV